MSHEYGALDRARAHFDRFAWSSAYQAFLAAERAAPLAPADLERLATAAYLSGHDAESADAWVRGHQSYLKAGSVERAAGCAFWLAFALLHNGDHARASGWLARARRLLDDGKRDCVELGYLLIPVAVQSVSAGDAKTAYETFSRSLEIAERFADADLATLARHGQGRALIRLGRTEAGVALLDEAMATVESGTVSPMIAGDVYCSVIEACHEILDVRRAQEWTAALTHFCESQPDLVPYRGQCLIRRSELLQLKGAWQDAMQEAVRACERLSHPLHPAVGAALYQRAELHRLRGEFAEAETAYREASTRMRTPLPGPALLRLAHGDRRGALEAVRTAAEQARAGVNRAKVLGAFVEIALANGEIPTAQHAAEELVSSADQAGAPYLAATAAYAQGSVLLAQGRVPEALPVLQRAYDAWQEIDVPYEQACVRVRIAEAARATGDTELAAIELDAAHRVFDQLGARPDLARVALLRRSPAHRYPNGLSRREVDVLRLVAAGRTNREIASTLYISEKTVARHMSNIFTKLHISTRSAAAAYALTHGLA